MWIRIPVVYRLNGEGKLMKLTKDQRALLLREARLIRQALHNGDCPDPRAMRCQRERAEEIERMLGPAGPSQEAGSVL